MNSLKLTFAATLALSAFSTVAHAADLTPILACQTDDKSFHLILSQDGEGGAQIALKGTGTSSSGGIADSFSSSNTDPKPDPSPFDSSAATTTSSTFTTNVTRDDLTIRVRSSADKSEINASVYSVDANPPFYAHFLYKTADGWVATLLTEVQNTTIDIQLKCLAAK